MDLSYGGNPNKFGHADYYGNKNAGVSIKELYDYVNRNQGSLYEGNRYGGYAGLSDEVRRDYQNWEQEQQRKQEEERRRQEEQRRAQEESQREIMATRANAEPESSETKQPRAESYIKLNFGRPSDLVGGNEDASPFASDTFSVTRDFLKEKRSQFRPTSRKAKNDSDTESKGYGLDLRRSAKEKSSNWMKLQDRREQRASDREAFNQSYIGRAY